MWRAAACGAIAVFLMTAAACDAGGSDTGTVEGIVRVSRPCPVETSPVPTPSSPTPEPSGSCRGPVIDATVRALKIGSRTVVLTRRTASQGRFSLKLPAGAYTLEATPLSAPAGHGIPLDVHVQANATVKVTLLVDTGVQ